MIWVAAFRYFFANSFSLFTFLTDTCNHAWCKRVLRSSLRIKFVFAHESKNLSTSIHSHLLLLCPPTVSLDPFRPFGNFPWVQNVSLWKSRVGIPFIYTVVYVWMPYPRNWDAAAVRRWRRFSISRETAGWSDGKRSSFLRFSIWRMPGGGKGKSETYT